MVGYKTEPFAPTKLLDYQKQTGLDAHSLVPDPKFIDADALDSQLAGDSPARRLSWEGGPVGAQRRLQQ